MTTRTAPDYLSPEVVTELRDNLTMLDVFKGRRAAGSDRETRGLHSYHQAALRLELVPAGTTVEDFLVRLRTDDFNRIMGESGPNSPTPESGGETEPTSSGGTDTPLESSSSSPPISTMGS